MLKLTVYKGLSSLGDPSYEFEGEDVQELISKLHKKTLMSWSGKLNNLDVEDQMKNNDVVEGEVYYPKGDKDFWYVVKRL